MFKHKRFELAFIAILSVLVLAIFYVLISMNGVILGNDPAVHLEKAQIFLNTGKVPLANLGWTPPLYEIVLAMFIAMSGANQIGQLIFLVKVVAILCDWLLVFSAYLLGSKFFNKRVGLVASILLLMSLPMFEANQFGGYTTVLALAFMLLVFLYTPLAVEGLGYLAVAFFAAFGLVLSHQLAAFLSVFIMPPILLYMLIKSKGKYLKVVATIVIGGGVAFFLYYAVAMLPYLGYLGFVLFGIKAYAYQIPATSLESYLTNFGFILFLGAVGVVVAGYQLLKSKKHLLALILMLSFFVPLFFAESYYFGFYLPFAWFIYYLMPPLVILASVSVVFFTEKFAGFYHNHRLTFKKNWVRAVTIALIALLVIVVVYRSDTVYGKILEGSVYYSTTDVKALDAGLWLKNNYPANSTVISTYIPGFWLQEFSGMHVIAETDPTVQRTELAESVLSLSFEVENPQTLLKGYEAKGDISEETYISMDQVWSRVAYSSGNGDFLSYSANGVDSGRLALSHLNKQIQFDEQSSPKKIVFIYTNEDINLTKTLTVENNSYPISVSWTLTPLKPEVSNASLYLSTFFELKYKFDKAQVPGLLDWVNPWDAPSPMKTHEGNTWVVASFAGTELKDGYIGLYDNTNDVAFAFNFKDSPVWANIGALQSRQIDAVRFGYQFSNLTVNQAESRSYEVLGISKNSYAPLQPNELANLFNLKPTEFKVSARSFSDYIKENYIDFIVYDRNRLDPQMLHSKLLQLVYSNDRYIIFKISI